MSGNGWKSLPLEGVRVLDFSHVWAGPYCARVLGDMGADVIKIEAARRYDQERGPAEVKVLPLIRVRPYPDGDPGPRPYNRAGRFNIYNRSKMGLTLDLAMPQGLELARRLVAVADVVVENFSVGVMKRLGLDYDECKSLRPDIVYISVSGFGRTGPEAGYAAYGLTQEALSGLSSMTGYEGGPPKDTGVFYGDPTGGLFGAVAVVAALWHRRFTGRGQLIDLSQREAMVTTIPELCLEYVMNGRVMTPQGNRHPLHAPHGCYCCKGDDAWVAITVTSDAEFQAMCRVIGRPELAEDPRFADAPSRKKHEKELDEAVTAWTLQHDHYEVMHCLQQAGVPAGAVLTNREVVEDPHLQARGLFQMVTHTEAGTHPQLGMPWKLSRTPTLIRRPAPCLGEHNELILGQLLGLSPEELASLERGGVIGKEPPKAS